MTRKRPPIQQIPNSLPQMKELDTRKRAYAHLVTTHGRHFHTLASKGEK